MVKHTSSSQLYVGLNSGTSIDSIDAVLVDFATHPLTLIGTHREAFPANVTKALLTLAKQADQYGKCSIKLIGQLDVKLGLLFAKACQKILKKYGYQPQDIIAIGSHGQTIQHQPYLKYPFTWQIGDPNIIAERTGIKTVADFRRRDMAREGQGAPLVPGFHHSLFHHAEKNRAIVNIGGIANVTYLPKNNSQPILGFDTGPGNGLLDAWIKRNSNHAYANHAYDSDGNLGRSGKVIDELLHAFLEDDYFQKKPPKSTGKEYFNLTNIIQKYPQLEKYSVEDVQATFTHLTAKSILNGLKNFLPKIDEIFICGGGVHNAFLMELLNKFGEQKIQSTQVLGVDPDWIEPMAFAWLAKQRLEGCPGNITSVTGAKKSVVLGGIY